MGKLHMHITQIEEQAKNFGQELELIPCYYCGLVATTIDHVIPRVILKMLRDLGDKEAWRTLRTDYRIMEVDACKECNCMLSCSYQSTLALRKKFLKTRLMRKYRKILDTPDWSDEDLDNLGYNLRSHIVRCMYAKEIIKKRLKW